MTRVSGADPMHVWLVGRLCWFLLAWFATHAYLRTWFDVRTSILGTATVAALLPTTYTNSWAHPDHVPELALFTLGCLAAARRDDFWFAVVLLLATLNRETAVFLLPVYLVAAPVTGRRSHAPGRWRPSGRWCSWACAPGWAMPATTCGNSGGTSSS